MMAVLISKRKESDLGRVFPSGVKIDRAAYGLGAFSYAFIPKGTPIGRVSGTVVKDRDYGSNYCINLEDGKVLEPDPPFCYINHSCEPNCQLMQYVRDGDEKEGETLETGSLGVDEMDDVAAGNPDDEEDDLVDMIFDDDDDECFFGEGAAEERWDETESAENDATAEVSPETDDDEQRFEDDIDADIWVETVRDILPGEELSIDYAWPPEYAIRCRCGSPNCRGWIVARDELDQIDPSKKTNGATDRK